MHLLGGLVLLWNKLNNRSGNKNKCEEIIVQFKSQWKDKAQHVLELLVRSEAKLMRKFCLQTDWIKDFFANPKLTPTLKKQYWLIEIRFYLPICTLVGANLSPSNKPEIPITNLQNVYLCFLSNFTDHIHLHILHTLQNTST